MPTLRQKVDTFCKESGSKVSDSDKLRNQLGMMKQKMKKMQDTHKHELHLAKAAAKTQKAKVPKSPKVPKAPKTRRAPKIKQEVAMNPLPAQAEPMMPAPAPTLAPAAPAQPKGGRSRRRRMR